MLEKIYFDCNVLLDWVLKRAPFWDSANLLVELVRQKQIVGVVSPLTIANAHYFVRKKLGKVSALEFIKSCQQIFEFCDNSGAALDQAIDNFFRDFEDDIHFYSAVGSGVKIIVTRNPKDFPNIETVSVLTPDEALVRLGY